MNHTGSIIVDDSSAAAIAALLRVEATQGHAPAIAVAVVDGGRIVHSACHGSIGDQPVTEHTRFRIASMTKSFTAALVLALRDDGELNLDDPIAMHVPQLTSLTPPTTDSRTITVRDLLTMSAGLATDDPWADRQLAATPADMDDLFHTGATFAAAPGVDMNYSNYGYAMLGRMIERLTGVGCSQAITERVLVPLGMHETTFDLDAVDRSAVSIAEPHRVIDDTAFHEGFEPLADGGFAAMGGLWSTTADLAIWIGFFADAFPPRSNDDPYSAVLSRASRREMQQLHRADTPPTLHHGPDGRLRQITLGYGMGLNRLHHLDVGPIVSHSGGLPGYGSHMRWLPECGVGFVALANVTYSPMRMLSLAVMEALIDAGVLTMAPARHDDSLLRPAATALAHLISDWDDGVARTLFADNMLKDEPIEHYRRSSAALVERHGRLTLRSLAPISRTEADAVLAGERGSVKLEIQLGSMVPPLVQWYGAESLPDEEST